jgi:tetratricopeptide (TPR) repeat protein
MSDIFISHSSRDDDFVRDLRATLADHGLDAWIDSRELTGGAALSSEIKQAIEDASGYAVVVSTDALQSKWVGKELRHAIKVQEQRGKEKFPVIPLSLNGTKLGMMEEFFDDEPIYIPVGSDAGGVEAAINAILVALGKRSPADVAATAQPKSEPLEELVLELTDLKFLEKDGVRCASARARLVYEPATPGQEEVRSAQSWRLIAPPIDAEELRWYLEKYAIWPSHFRNRARKVEENLVKWGQLLYQAAMPVVHTADVLSAWARIGDQVDRRFSVYVDTALEEGAPDDDVKAAKEAGTQLLALPWELLHDGDGYLFQGAKPVCVRRRLPKTKVLDVPVVATPIRILLVTARPEDDSYSYIDHRASALPLVEAMESLPGLVKIHVLSPPTLPALSAELERARNEKKPYHVVHFNGFGVFDREAGQGGLCFEKPEDVAKLENRGHVTVFTTELGPLLRDHRIPLVFLEASQTAQAEKASESVASELLKVGVVSVVAMSHNVLVETARRFVEAFYRTLAAGQRVGDAMLAGQRALKDDTFRDRIFGAGELRLEDWFVPVLYQEKDDPQLFKVTPAKQTQEDFQARLAARLGELPAVPETGFIGRGRELLALQRLLRKDHYAVVRGQSGEGKTALAAEFARWMVRSQQIHRAAFVSVETHRNQRAVVDALGKQLINREFSAAGDLEDAIRQVERALREQSSLLVIDTMESVLLPPFMGRAPEAPSTDARAELEAILALCERLLKAGETRIVFTTREVLPQPFSGERNRRELDRLAHNDAVKLVERLLNATGNNAGTSSDVAHEESEQLVGDVHCHARTLALLAPVLRQHGVEATRESLVELMAEMEKNFPGSREKSVFANVELSLKRMSPQNRERARVLGVFQGGAQLRVVKGMMQWEDDDVESLARELIETGLATRKLHDHLALDPALCPYMRATIDPAELEQLTVNWVSAMQEYVEFLREQQVQNINVAATLTRLDLSNLLTLLDVVQRAKDAEATIDLATTLCEFLQTLGKPRLMERIGQIRDAAARELGDTLSHLQFEAARSRIEQQLIDGELDEALAGARKLHDGIKNAGEQAYPGADYDIAYACFTLSRALNKAGSSDRALLLLDESLQRFEAIAKSGHEPDADEKVSLCFTEKGECLRCLGQLDEAVAAYEEGIRRDEERGDLRGIAVGRFQIGSIRSDQLRYEEALEGMAEAIERFTQLDERESLAIIWHQMGNAYHNMEEYGPAEDAYRKALALEVQLGDVDGQGDTLSQLGMTYASLDRLEEAVDFYRQAVDKAVEHSDISKEGLYRNNLAESLRKLERFDEARQEIRRAIECKSQFGHASHLWLAWTVLESIETDTGNLSAAADARRKAIDSYLAYRRDGGENYDDEGNISLEVTEHLLAGDNAGAASFLQEVATDPDLPSYTNAYIRALQAIVAGSRDRALADAPDLDYMMAAEILFLIETLENHASTK